MATFRRSAACCSTPSIIGPAYESKGKFIDMDGTTCYTSGSESASKAIFILYDVFGYSSQILEGADKVAAAGYQVFMPDFFDGKPCPLDWMPIDESTVDEAAIDAFIDSAGETQETLRSIAELLEKFKRLHPAIERWGLLGYCWGGYIVNFAILENTAFACAVQCHAGWPGADVATKVSVPLLALNSKDETERDYAEFRAALKVENHFEDFPDQLHGWLSARGDLEKSRVRAEYDRGYRMIIDWFARYL